MFIYLHYGLCYSKIVLMGVEKQTYATWKSYLIITKNNADISMMTLDNESIATRYWMNTPHMNGGFKYAVGVIFANGFAAQDMASHSTRGARPPLW